ncbi:MAG: UDP-N-acetylglucosamine 1-carboxyvinyltransferase [Fibrobacteres bacterium]|jgi:UDP-N-acetylglucosamine 1-carboxyvinyltransferase|nr:UDP-N-acetylglucosamine 1-carboxyvinyltransferase [Fibrobacterota bacterium]
MYLKIKGPQRVEGEVVISGAKNAASKMMVASLLTDEPVILHNFPKIDEIEIVRELVEKVGANVEVRDHTLVLSTPTILTEEVVGLSRANRISVLALPALLHRKGRAVLPVLGGDKIGPRPVNYHLDALRAMGVRIQEEGSAFVAEAPFGLCGTHVNLPYPSVGATENILLAGVLAKGRTVIENAALEPEILDLIMMLQNMGAIIELGTGRTISIDGVERLHGGSHEILPDRMEAASYACMALATGGRIFCRHARQADMLTFLNAVRRIGADYEVMGDGIVFFRKGPMRGIDLETDTHPGFMTDWQQPFTLVLTQCEGTSVVHETVYEDRFGYTKALNQLGARITVFDKCLGELPCRFRSRRHPHSAIIQGATPLKAVGKPLEIFDIRAGITLVIAALCAEGSSQLNGLEHLDRGYENLLGKLKGLGIEVERS